MNYQNLLVHEPSTNIRAAARASLKGNWGKAFLVGSFYYLFASLPETIFNGIMGNGGIFELINLMAYSSQLSYSQYNELLNTISSSSGFSTIYSLVILGPLTLGLSMFALSIFRTGKGGMEFLMSGFNNFFKAAVLHIVMGILVFLWSLLFLIPGIIAIYRYSMAYYILADNPEMNAMDAIRTSKYIMTGNKGKLFVLHLTFIGWGLLAGTVISVVLKTLLSSVTNGMYVNSTFFLENIVLTVVSSVCMGLLYVYMQVANVRFYELASGKDNYVPLSGDERM